MTLIFISYSSKDAKIAEEIENCVRNSGYDVWRDKRMIETDWSKEIACNLARSDLICLVWTNNSERSPMVKDEYLTVRALGKLVVPCMFYNSPHLPEPISMMEGVEFDKISDVSKLADHLKKLKSFSHDYNYSIRASNFNIPFNPNPGFTGRNLELVDLYLELIGNLKNIGVNLVGLIATCSRIWISFFFRISRWCLLDTRCKCRKLDQRYCCHC